MLTSLLFMAVAQQDSDDVQEKWSEVRAVWDGYAGVTGERGYGEPWSFTILRDGRYLVRTKRTVVKSYLGVDGLVTVIHFDGTRRIVYSAITGEYTIEDDPEPPRWSEPFQRLWATSQSVIVTKVIRST